jgi:signal transduction histidine kinase/signal recognition particle subunit SEC65
MLRGLVSQQPAWIAPSAGVLKKTSPVRSPTVALLSGLAVTLTAVVIYSCYLSSQISGLRTVQRELADRNRKDSLQLLRIQNDLNTLALAMRDMIDPDAQYPLTAWTAEFQRIRVDLADAFRKEDQVAIGRRSPLQRQYLASSVAQFWDGADRLFALAESGKKNEALSQIRLSLQTREATLSNSVARLLVENNEDEEQTALRVGRIYDGVQHQAYAFLACTLVTILLTTLYLIHSSRQLFARISLLSQQRSELAQKLISTQESTLRHVSRELHDEFGQILTAIGAMLALVHNRVPEDSCIHSSLVEVREITQSALDNVRSLSQALHPVILDEVGLESTLDWYLPKVEKQTRVAVSYEKTGTRFGLENRVAIHIYRVLQEALNNAIRHSGASQVWIRLRYLCSALMLEVEDHGSGFPAQPIRCGVGLIGMYERAELLGGHIEILKALPAGTLVRLTVPRAGMDSHEK